MHLSIKFQSDCLIEIYLWNYRFYSWLNRNSLLSLVELFNGASFSNLIKQINSLLILRNVCEIHLEKCWENCFCQISSSLYINFKGFSIESFIVCFQSKKNYLQLTWLRFIMTWLTSSYFINYGRPCKSSTLILYVISPHPDMDCFHNPITIILSSRDPIW